MNRDKLATAVAEAKRFLEAAKAWQTRTPEYDWQGSKEGGAVKRASMDLTRALAELRKPL